MTLPFDGYSDVANRSRDLVKVKGFGMISVISKLEGLNKITLVTVIKISKKWGGCAIILKIGRIKMILIKGCSSLSFCISSKEHE